MRAVIVGAGIGGLSAGLCLQREGWTVRVLEKAPRLSEIGAGIQLSPNACRVLAKLNVLETIQKDAVRPRQLEMRTGVGGHKIFNLQPAQSSLAPYLHCHRADLVASLSTALVSNDKDALVLGTAVESYRQDSTGIRAKTRNNEFSADLLIGAGGLHCPIRSQMHGDAKAIDTGHCAWRALIPIADIDAAALPEGACVWTGASRHVVTYRVRRGELVNLVAVVEARPGANESWEQLGEREDVLRDFAGWQPIILDLIRKAPDLHKWALFERAPLPAWHEGHAVLLGDACHPMLPFMAQGAAMAIEDAWQLAHSLGMQSGLPGALEHYYSKRSARTKRVQAQARTNARTFHRQNAISQTMAYAPLWLAGRLAPSLAARKLSWLYDFDVTQE